MPRFHFPPIMACCFSPLVELGGWLNTGSFVAAVRIPALGDSIASTPPSFSRSHNTSIPPTTPTTTNTTPIMPPAFPKAFAAPPKNGLGDGCAIFTPPRPVVMLVEFVTLAVVVMFAPTNAGATYEPFTPPPMPPMGLQSFCVRAVTTVVWERRGQSLLHPVDVDAGDIWEPRGKKEDGVWDLLLLSATLQLAASHNPVARTRL